MTYEITKPVRYCTGPKDSTMIEIPVGTRVSSVSFASMPPSEREACKRMADRERRQNPNRRLIFFEYAGRMRGLAVDSLKRVRR